MQIVFDAHTTMAQEGCTVVNILDLRPSMAQAAQRLVGIVPRRGVEINTPKTAINRAFAISK